MRAFVANTDFDWYEHLSGLPVLDEVNFWMPRPWGGQFGVRWCGRPLLNQPRAPFRESVKLALVSAREPRQQEYTIPLRLDADETGTGVGLPLLGCIAMSKSLDDGSGCPG